MPSNDMHSTPFEELQRISEESGVEKSLDFLEHHFRKDKDFFKLFEVMKMRCRHQLGLPLIYSQQPDDLSESQQRELEDRLLSACREIGTLFFKSSMIQEGWMYLQPVGDKQLNEKLIGSIKPDQGNIDTLIEIAISQGGAPAYGFELLLNHYGTCDGITTFDTQAARFDVDTQRQMASRLVNHLHGELLKNIRHWIKESDAQPEKDSKLTPDYSLASLEELIELFPKLTANGAQHIDTTHLSAAMRIARSLQEPSEILIAKELAAYGSKLDKDLQYPGAAPFEDTYLDHAMYFSALLGEQVDEAIEHFKSKTETVDSDQFGPVADETLVELLVRVGRTDEALEAATQRLMGNENAMGIAPSVFEIAKNSAQLQKLKDAYRSQDDLLGFAVAVLKKPLD